MWFVKISMHPKRTRRSVGSLSMIVHFELIVLFVLNFIYLDIQCCITANTFFSASFLPSVVNWIFKICIWMKYLFCFYEELTNLKQWQFFFYLCTGWLHIIMFTCSCGTIIILYFIFNFYFHFIGMLKRSKAISRYKKTSSFSR